jgi:GNAT superfamily N-acetyltransferase
MKLEPLSQAHDREGFDCGAEPLNLYLQRTARQHAEKGISKTFVLVAEDAVAPRPVLGFFTLGICELLAEDLPPAFAKRYPQRVPCVRLGRLAVDRRQQGRGYGAALLAAALRKVHAACMEIGGAALIVDAKDAQAAAFYRKFQFQPFASDPLKLYLPAATITALIAES